MPTVHYIIAMPQPVTHLYEVTIEARGLEATHADWIMPSWTPGSYLIREFARHVQEFGAADGASGRPLDWSKLDKSTWRVAIPPSGSIRVHYRVYANELTVRSSHLDADHGYFNGASVFMYSPMTRRLPQRLTVVPPAGWRVSTGLSDDDNRVEFEAEDYDHLIDCPAEIGTHRVVRFEAAGRPHRLALWGHGNEDESRLASDLAKIVEAAVQIFEGAPYEHYLFILHLTDKRRGGLEHRNSNTSGVSRFDFVKPQAYERVVELLAHEFFHTWNVKRIRPAAFDEFEYRAENYTRLLWVMEGVTSYYAPRVLQRAGLITSERYLELLGQDYLRLLQTPGQRMQSVEQASFDAWIKHYRPDENTQNTAVSYYLKGSLVAVLLDLWIRTSTSGARSLDDVLRHIWHSYTEQGRGVPEEDFQAACEAVAASSLEEFFRRYVRGLDPLPLPESLSAIGLNLTLGYKDAEPDEEHPAGLGLRLRESGGKLTVHTVFTDGPAYLADVCADDEVIALNGYRVDLAALRQGVANRRPGDAVTLHLFRRDELRTATIVLGRRPHNKATIVRSADATQQQRFLAEGWLGA